MSQFRIAVRKPGGAYEPGEEIAGGVQWLLDQAPKTVEGRLVWYTGSPRGMPAIQPMGVAPVKTMLSEETVVVERVLFDGAQQDDTRSFRFTAPPSPHSFSGSLFTVNWAIDIVALPHNESTRIEVVIAPGGKAIRPGYCVVTA